MQTFFQMVKIYLTIWYRPAFPGWWQFMLRLTVPLILWTWMCWHCSHFPYQQSYVILFGNSKNIQGRLAFRPRRASLEMPRVWFQIQKTFRKYAIDNTGWSFWTKTWNHLAEQIFEKSTKSTHFPFMGLVGRLNLMFLLVIIYFH